MPLLKDCAGVEIVDTVALAASIDVQLTTARGTKEIGIRYGVPALGTDESLRMKVLQNPLFAFRRTE